MSLHFPLAVTLPNLSIYISIYLSIYLSNSLYFSSPTESFSFYSCILSFSRANINTIYLSINLSIKCSIFFFSYRVFSFYLCRLCLLLLRPRKYQKREQTKKCKKFDRKFFCLSHLRLLCHTRN